MQHENPKSAAPVGVVARRDAPIVSKLMDCDCRDYTVEIEPAGEKNEAIWRDFGHLASLGGAATLLLSLSDWLKLGR